MSARRSHVESRLENTYFTTMMIPIQYRRNLRHAVPALMLMLLVSSIVITAYHNTRECGDPHSCAVCTFHATSYTLSSDAEPGTDPCDAPGLPAVITLVERASEPFHTTVFASHAPPPFC